MKLKIGTAGRKIKKDQDIFVLHAGRDKMFIDSFLSESKVWMELPELDLSKLTFDNEGSFTKESMQQLQRARAIANYRYRNKGQKAPPDDLSSYKPRSGLGTGGALDARTMNAIKYLYFTAPKGSLVIVPGFGFTGRVLVGELRGPEPARVKTRQGNIPARRVKWIETEGIKHKFSVEFVITLSHQRALHYLPLTLREELYDYVYGDWCYDDNSAFTLKVKPSINRGNDVDPSALAALNLFVVYYGTLYDKLALDEKAELPGFKSQMPSLLGNQSAEYAWEGSIHSPGEVKIRIRNPFKAAFISSMLSFSATVSAAQLEELKDEVRADISVGADAAAAGEDVVQVTNLWNKVPTDCEIDVSEKIRQALVHMNLDVWQANCRAQQQLVNQNLVIESNTTISLEGDDND